jgi:histidine triad (HIT) family protein
MCYKGLLEVDCIFCKIANKTIESKIVNENDQFIAFLDINPIVDGHCIVIPKKHCTNIIDASKEQMSGCLEFIQNTAQKIMHEYYSNAYNILNANGKEAQQSVAHLHFHIIPRYENDRKELWIENTE